MEIQESKGYKLPPASSRAPEIDVGIGEYNEGQSRDTGEDQRDIGRNPKAKTFIQEGHS